MESFTQNSLSTSSVERLAMATRTPGSFISHGSVQSESLWQQKHPGRGQCGLVDEETWALALHLPLGVGTLISHKASEPHILHGSIEMVVSDKASADA